MSAISRCAVKSLQCRLMLFEDFHLIWIFNRIMLYTMWFRSYHDTNHSACCCNKCNIEVDSVAFPLSVCVCEKWAVKFGYIAWICETCKVQFCFWLLSEVLHWLHVMSSSWVCVCVCARRGFEGIVCVNCHEDEMWNLPAIKDPPLQRWGQCPCKVGAGMGGVPHV